MRCAKPTWYFFAGYACGIVCIQVLGWAGDLAYQVTLQMYCLLKYCPEALRYHHGFGWIYAALVQRVMAYQYVHAAKELDAWQ